MAPKIQVFIQQVDPLQVSSVVIGNLHHLPDKLNTYFAHITIICDGVTVEFHFNSKSDITNFVTGIDSALAEIKAAFAQI